MRNSNSMEVPERLVERARKGDQTAISELYEQSYSEAFYAVKSMIRDEDTVSDILQDSFLKAFTHLDGFAGNDKFVPWVRQIAANTARDWLKKKRPLLFSELAADEDDADPIEERFVDENPAAMPEQVLDENETKRLLQEIVGELPEDQRAAIGMYYYEEMSVKEIAAAMGASENAVKSRLLYGRRKIETKVRDLEKKGTKLYGLAPIPFLLWLLRGEKIYATEQPSEAILQAVLKALPSGRTATAAGATAKTASTAAKTASAAAGAAKGIGTAKLAVIAIAAVAVIGAGAFGISRAKRQSAILTPDEILPAAESVEVEAEEAVWEESAEEEPMAAAEEEPEVEDPSVIDRNALAAFTEAEEAAGRIVFTGEIATYNYEATVSLQGFPDYNAEWTDKTQVYRIIVLDEPREVTFQSVDGPYTATVEMFSVNDAGIAEDLDGHRIVFSVDPDNTWWKSDTSIPLGAPNLKDVHVMQ